MRRKTMTFKDAMELNEKQLRLQWAQRKTDLLEALKDLKRTIATIEQQVSEPIPDLGLHEMYVGSGGYLRIHCEEVCRTYEGLESVKLRAKFIGDLKRAVSA
jgi:hypothetical protein